MAQDDIYGNKGRYERFVNNLEDVLQKPQGSDRRKKYYCKNRANLKYFRLLIRRFEVDDLSYIRRLRLLYTLKFLTYHIAADLKDVNGNDRDNLIIQIRKSISSSNLGKTEMDIKRVGVILFEEKDRPEFFTNFKIRTDKSRERAKKDKLTFEEYERIINFFSGDEVMQAYIALAFETLARPQEIFFLKIGGVELFDNYATLQVAEHGKEGPKQLLSADSFPYLLRMLEKHKDGKNKEAYLFLNQYGRQMTPYSINKRIRKACKKLMINKPITCYSLKRFGVTYRRLQGESDVEIQHIAGWTSIKQLKAYDQSDRMDVFKRQLIKRGLLKDNSLKVNTPKTKVCQYCSELIGFAESICPKCKHIIDRSLIRERINKDREIIEFIRGIEEFKKAKPEIFEAIRNMGREKGIITQEIKQH